MSSLYKYTSRKYLDSFFSDGSIKIGTQHEYRNRELYDNVIGDSEEGVSRMITKYRNIKHFLKENKQNRQKVIFSNSTHTPLAVLDNSSNGVVSTTCDNIYYIYCVTEIYSETTLKDFSSDSCIEILYPDKFFAAISEAIKDKCKYLGYSNIIYTNRLYHYMKPHEYSSILIKDPKYRYQNEVRAIWKPIKKVNAPSIEINNPKHSSQNEVQFSWKPDEKVNAPLFIEVPKARAYCRVYSA